jgi:hypothetical protein
MVGKKFEEFLIDLEAEGNTTVLQRLPEYLIGHYIQCGNIVAERERLIISFRDKAPITVLSDKMLDMIIQI